MKLWEVLGRIDRRIIYTIMAVVVIVPLIATIKLPSKVRAMPRTKDVFNHIETIDVQSQRKALMLSIDFDPQVEPELKPQFEAVVRHAFARNVPLVVAAPLNLQGVGIGVEVMERLAREHGKEYGKDYVMLGWIPGGTAVVLGMGNSIEQTYRADYNGTPISEIPMMQDIRNYDDVGLIISFTGSSTYATWVTFAYTPFSVPVATGITAVSVADIYPMLGSKQLIGMLAGMKAGAEYERLVKDKYYAHKDIFLRATQSLPALSASLIVIILFVIIGNVSHFATRRKS